VVTGRVQEGEGARDGSVCVCGGDLGGIRGVCDEGRYAGCEAGTGVGGVSGVARERGGECF